MSRDFGLDLDTKLDVRGAVDRAVTSVFGHRPEYELRAGPFLAHELQVIELDGREEMSACFRFDVRVVTSVPDAIAERFGRISEAAAAALRAGPEALVEALLLGQPATLSMAVRGGPERRLVQGIVAAVQAEGYLRLDADSDSAASSYRLRIVPRLWLLRRKKRSQIFQNMTVPDIVSAVLNDNHVPHVWRTTKSYDAREYCLQYQETDYDFVARLCADEGIFFYFEHPLGLADAFTGGVGASAAGALGAIAQAAGDGAAGDALDETAGRVGLVEKVAFGDKAIYPAFGAGGVSVGAALGVVAEGSKAVRGAAEVTREAGLSVDAPELRALGLFGEGVKVSGEVVSEFTVRRTLRTKSVLLTDYDFKKPQRQVRAGAAIKRFSVSAEATPHLSFTLDGRLSAGAHAGAHADSAALGYDPEKARIHDHDGSQDAKADEDDARTYLEQLRQRVLVGRGRSWSWRLIPGYRFRIVEHPNDALNDEYVCTRVTHKVRPAEGSFNSRALVYENKFQCVPARRAYRPARNPRTLGQVLETAVVVESKEADADTLGRVKVHFHWDDKAPNERSSCLIRVAQPWAGASSVQFIPRVGMEVLVSFIAGDPDRPVIVGCLYNPVNPPAFHLPAEKTKSGIRTCPVDMATGYSEIVFDDLKGAETLGIKAQRDLDVEVGNDWDVVVGRADAGGGASGNHTLSVHGQHWVGVGGSQEVRVSGSALTHVGIDRNERVRRDARVQVGGDVFEQTGGCHYQSIEKTHRYEVGAGLVERITGDRRTHVAGDHPVFVDGQHTLTVTGDAVCSVGEDFDVTVGRSQSFDAVEAIRLVCGSSSIELRPDEIVIRSPKISLSAGDTLLACAPDASLTLTSENAALQTKTKAVIGAKEVDLYAGDKESSLVLSGDAAHLAAKGSAQVTGDKKVGLKGKGAAIALDDDLKGKGGTVSLFGSQGGVKLQDGSADADSGAYDKTKPDKLDTSWIEIELQEPIFKGGDPDGSKLTVPVGGARYEIEAGGKTYHGVLDAKGRARVPIRPGAAKVTFPDYDGDAVEKKS